MKYQSFIMRVLCLLLIVGVVLGYNSMQKKDSDTEKDQQIASLTTRVEALEKQQDEILSALEETAKAHNITKTALIIVGDIVAHQHYEKSRLYAPDFETEFRKMKKSREKE